MSLKSTKLGFLARTKSALGYVSGAKYKASEMRPPSAQRGASREKGDIKLTIGGPIEWQWLRVWSSSVVFLDFWDFFGCRMLLLPCCHALSQIQKHRVFQFIRARVASKAGKDACARACYNKTERKKCTYIRVKVCIPPFFPAFHGLGKRVLQEGPLLQELQGDQLADSSEVSWR